MPPISDVCVNEEGVLFLLLQLDVKKSPGVDGIPNAFLVRHAEWCTKYLCLLFNKSLECSELPEDWVYAKITPIPKGNETAPTYRHTDRFLFFPHMSKLSNILYLSTFHNFLRAIALWTPDSMASARDGPL